MMKTSIALALVFASIGLAPIGDAHADVTTDAVTRLEAAGGTMKWVFVPSGRHERFGHAEAIVSAPPTFVREQATDFAHYRDMSNGRIRTSRLVDKTNNATDVYLQVPVLHGMITLWQVLRFTDVHVAADGTQTLTGALVSGNVHASEMTITMRPASGGRTLVQCDLLITPQFAAPQSLIDAELRDAAESAVLAMRGRAEQKYAQSLPPQVTGDAVVAK